jgi:predicted transcriptional regulator
LRRYIKRKFNLTPHEYREKWGLPNDYPFVAPAYSRKRSKIAKKTGLGRKS